jgi:16S rRNA (adenine1518-N6/adenine1519-N6)-dimethyltransferase
VGNNTRTIMRKYNVRPKKSLGQNFLINDHVKKKIIEAINITEDDLIIEIGAGLGILTKEIADKSDKLIAIEKDNSLIPILKEVLKDFDKIKIIDEDILELDITEIKNEIIKESIEKGKGFEPKHIKAVGNLPYYITTPIIIKLLKGGTKINQMIFMIQKEVAERIVAKPGTKSYGALTLVVNYYSCPKILFSVSPSSFVPKPKVDSSVIRLNVLSSPCVTVIDEDLFFKIIKASFGQRRKTLVNSLYNSNLLPFSKKEIINILNDLKIKENARGETLSLEHFAQLSNTFSQKYC